MTTSVTAIISTKSFGLTRDNQWKIEGDKLYISTYVANEDQYSEWALSTLPELVFGGDIWKAWNYLQSIATK